MGPIALALDMTVTFGNVLQIAGTAVLVFLAYAALRERLARIETMIDPLWREYEARRGRR